MRIDWKSPQLLVSIFVLVAYSLSVGAVMIQAGENPTSFSWWLGALPFLGWCIAPIAAPLVFRSWIMTVGVAAVAGWGSYEYNIEMLGPGARSTSALAFIFLPIYQWMAIAVVLGIDWAARRITKR